MDWYWKSLLKVDNDDDITLRGDLNFQIIEGAYTVINISNTKSKSCIKFNDYEHVEQCLKNGGITTHLGSGKQRVGSNKS